MIYVEILHQEFLWIKLSYYRHVSNSLWMQVRVFVKK